MQSKHMKGKVKNFKTVGDQKALDRQRMITLHYVQVAIDRDRLEEEALAMAQSRDDYEY
jgi:hypothetical protein